MLTISIPGSASAIFVFFEFSMIFAGGESYQFFASSLVHRSAQLLVWVVSTSRSP
jgi:hypothetical protein